MKVGICSLGCKVNIYESELVTNILKNNNYTVVDFEDKADIYIINTCSVTNESDKKSRKMINRAKKNNPAAIIIVMGCYSQVNAEDIDVDIVLGNKDKSKIVEIIEEYIKTKQKKKVPKKRRLVSFRQNRQSSDQQMARLPDIRRSDVSRLHDFHSDHRRMDNLSDKRRFHPLVSGMGKKRT